NYKTDSDFKLGTWISYRRTDYRTNKLSKKRIKILESKPGWRWNIIETVWMEGLDLLEQYIEKNGNASSSLLRDWHVLRLAGNFMQQY
ncbi:hypothetical protein DRO61_09760, partial [Candidatus Bathyarchaeota archaeon]